MAKLPLITQETMDTQETKLHKDLLIFACGFMNLAVALWLAIYLLMSTFLCWVNQARYSIITE